MQIKRILAEYSDTFLARYKGDILPSQIKALNAMRSCRTKEAGELYVACPDCGHKTWKPLSCGHRNCPQCQNYEASQWIDRKQKKHLPVPYYMVTFTLPRELRSVVYRNQRKAYALLFECVSTTLKDFALNPKYLGAEIGMTMVLHTHSRRLAFHPHIHVVLPGGGIHPSRRQWKKKKGKYLFPEKSLAKVFRARFLDGLNRQRLPIPRGVPSEWVVNCTQAGKGVTALKYLSRYLYRGVISEKNILSSKNGKVTFQYSESETGEIRHRTLEGEKFLRLLLAHVLPRGFRRVRDYGFLHGNAAKLLSLVQLVLHTRTPRPQERQRPFFICPHCKAHMVIIRIRPARRRPG